MHRFRESSPHRAYTDSRKDHHDAARGEAKQRAPPNSARICSATPANRQVPSLVVSPASEAVHLGAQRRPAPSRTARRGEGCQPTENDRGRGRSSYYVFRAEPRAAARVASSRARRTSAQPSAFRAPTRCPLRPGRHGTELPAGVARAPDRPRGAIASPRAPLVVERAGAARAGRTGRYNAAPHRGRDSAAARRGGRPCTRADRTVQDRGAAASGPAWWPRAAPAGLASRSRGRAPRRLRRTPAPAPPQLGGLRSRRSRAARVRQNIRCLPAAGPPTTERLDPRRRSAGSRRWQCGQYAPRRPAEQDRGRQPCAAAATSEGAQPPRTSRAWFLEFGRRTRSANAGAPAADRRSDAAVGHQTPRRASTTTQTDHRPAGARRRAVATPNASRGRRAAPREREPRTAQPSGNSTSQRGFTASRSRWNRHAWATHQARRAGSSVTPHWREGCVRRVRRPRRRRTRGRRRRR